LQTHSTLHTDKQQLRDEERKHLRQGCRQTGIGENILKRHLSCLGSADVGIVALSLHCLRNEKQREICEIPSSEYPAIEQACVILKSSQHKAAAKTFLDFIKTPVVADLFRAYGFSVPVVEPFGATIPLRCKAGSNCIELNKRGRERPSLVSPRGCRRWSELRFRAAKRRRCCTNVRPRSLKWTSS